MHTKAVLSLSSGMRRNISLSTQMKTQLVNILNQCKPITVKGSQKVRRRHM